MSPQCVKSINTHIYIVKVTLTSAHCDTVSHTPMTTTIFRQVQRTVGFGFHSVDVGAIDSRDGWLTPQIYGLTAWAALLG